jgi:hypothetical protein
MLVAGQACNELNPAFDEPSGTGTGGSGGPSGSGPDGDGGTDDDGTDGGGTGGGTGGTGTSGGVGTGTTGNTGTGGGTGTGGATGTSATATGSGSTTTDTTSPGCDPGVDCPPALVVWRESGSSTPRYSTWDHSSFGAEQNTVSAGEWRYVVGTASPTRPEAIVVGVTEGDDVRGMIWDGDAWSELPFNSLASVSYSYYRSFVVEYERQSGDAVLVWANGTAGSSPLSYRTFDGMNWSGEATIAAPAAGEPRQVHGSAKPGSNEIVLIVDGPGENYALVWDGTSWGNAQALGSSSGDTDINVTHEQQSGDALIVYGKSGSSGAHYRIWTTGWGAEGTIAKPGSENLGPRWFMLGPDPGSDRIALGVLTSGNGSASHTWLGMWNGTDWDEAIQVSTSQVSNMNYPNVAVAFERSTGTALATYVVDNSDDAVSYRIWSAGGGWGSQQTTSMTGFDGNSLTLDPDPLTDAMMLCVQDQDSDFGCAPWDGAGWGPSTLLADDTGETKNQPFVFLWSYVP